jgi:hypothetical protein
MANYYNVNRYLTEEIDTKEEKTIIFQPIERSATSLSQMQESSVENKTIKSFNSIEHSKQLAMFRINLQTKDN